GLPTRASDAFGSGVAATQWGTAAHRLADGSPPTWHAAWSTPTIPVGPSYDERLRPSREISTGSEASPVTDTGLVWGTSARSAPRVTTNCVPSASASSTITLVNERHRIEGSVPTTRIR